MFLFLNLGKQIQDGADYILLNGWFQSFDQTSGLNSIPILYPLKAGENPESNYLVEGFWQCSLYKGLGQGARFGFFSNLALETESWCTSQLSSHLRSIYNNFLEWLFILTFFYITLNKGPGLSYAIHFFISNLNSFCCSSIFLQIREIPPVTSHIIRLDNHQILSHDPQYHQFLIKGWSRYSIVSRAQVLASDRCWFKSCCCQQSDSKLVKLSEPFLISSFVK